MQETPVQFLGGEDPLEEGMASHCSVLAWRISWMEGQSMGLKESDTTWQLTTTTNNQGDDPERPKEKVFLRPGPPSICLVTRHLPKGRQLIQGPGFQETVGCEISWSRKVKENHTETKRNVITAV